ncbi:MAG TPA: ATP-binding protein [Stellaceae bacterium]|nr:ATP-binding protein [Stellaceae bacterium]
MLGMVGAGARGDLCEILEERYGRRSTILTSQIPVDKWLAFIGDPTYADAILDRLVHNHNIENLTKLPSRQDHYQKRGLKRFFANYEILFAIS